MLARWRREPFVSLARIFLACSLTPVEGLLRFPKVWDAYDETLGGLAPFRDLWVPLRLARTISADLGRLDELESLLDWDTRLAWTVEDREEGALLHNWRIPPENLPAVRYSTRSMLSASFQSIELLPAGAQIRTLLGTGAVEMLGPKGLAHHPDGALTSLRYQALYEKLIEWTVYEMAIHLDQRSVLAADDRFVAPVAARLPGQPVPVSGDEDVQPELRQEEPSRAAEPGQRLARLFLYDTLASLTMSDEPADEPSQGPPIDALSHLPSLPPLHRVSMLDDSTTHLGRTDTTSRFYLLDAVSRLVAQQHLDAELLDVAAQQGEKAATEAARLAEAAKYGELQQRVVKLESEAQNEALWAKEQALRDRLDRERLDALEADVERLALARQNRREAVRALLAGSGTDRPWEIPVAAFIAGIALGIALALAGSVEL